MSLFKLVGHPQRNGSSVVLFLALWLLLLCGPSHRQPELSAAQRSLHGRRELLEQACLSQNRKRQVLSPDDLKHLIVDDKHSLIYCYVPKVGGERVGLYKELNLSVEILWLLE